MIKSLVRSKFSMGSWLEIGTFNIVGDDKKIQIEAIATFLHV